MNSEPEKFTPEQISAADKFFISGEGAFGRRRLSTEEIFDAFVKSVCRVVGPDDYEAQIQLFGERREISDTLDPLH